MTAISSHGSTLSFLPPERSVAANSMHHQTRCVASRVASVIRRLRARHCPTGGPTRPRPLHGDPSRSDPTRDRHWLPRSRRTASSRLARSGETCSASSTTSPPSDPARCAGRRRNNRPDVVRGRQAHARGSRTSPTVSQGSGLRARRQVQRAIWCTNGRKIVALRRGRSSRDRTTTPRSARDLTPRAARSAPACRRRSARARWRPAAPSSPDSRRTAPQRNRHSSAPGTVRRPRRYSSPTRRPALRAAGRIDRFAGNRGDRRGALLRPCAALRRDDQQPATTLDMAGEPLGHARRHLHVVEHDDAPG